MGHAPSWCFNIWTYHAWSNLLFSSNSQHFPTVKTFWMLSSSFLNTIVIPVVLMVNEMKKSSFSQTLKGVAHVGVLWNAKIVVTDSTCRKLNSHTYHEKENLWWSWNWKNIALYPLLWLVWAFSFICPSSSPSGTFSLSLLLMSKHLTNVSMTNQGMIPPGISGKPVSLLGLLTEGVGVMGRSLDSLQAVSMDDGSSMATQIEPPP